MAKKSKEKELPFGVTQEFLSEVASMTVEQKKNAIVKLENEIENASEEVKLNDAIINAKNQLDYVQGPFKDSIKTFKNRKKILLKELKDAGVFDA